MLKGDVIEFPLQDRTQRILQIRQRLKAQGLDLALEPGVFMDAYVALKAIGLSSQEILDVLAKAVRSSSGVSTIKARQWLLAFIIRLFPAEDDDIG